MIRLPVLLAALLLVVSFSGPVAAGVPHFVFRESFGSAGHGSGQFMHPRGMAFSPDGRRLAIADTGNNRVVILRIASEAASIPGASLLSVETILGDIWPHEGTRWPTTPPDAYRERDHFDGLKPQRTYDGRPYLGGQGRIRPGELVPMDRFNHPETLAWKDNDTLLVVDTGNHRIKAVKADGEILWILGQEGWKDGYFHSPLGIALDGEGRIYVCEPRAKYLRGVGLDFLQRQRVQGNRIQIFKPDGGILGRIGHMHHVSGKWARQYKDLARLWVAPNGRLWVADSGNHRILVFDDERKVEKTLQRWPHADLRYPFGIDGDEKGRVAIVDAGHHRVLILDDQDNISQILGGFGVGNGQFGRPREARFGPDNRLFVADTDNCRIQVFDFLDPDKVPEKPKTAVAAPPSPDDVSFPDEFGQPEPSTSPAPASSASVPASAASAPAQIPSVPPASAAADISEPAISGSAGTASPGYEFQVDVTSEPGADPEPDTVIDPASSPIEFPEIPTEAATGSGSASAPTPAP